MRYRIPSTKKGLTVVGMGILLLIGLITGGEDNSGSGGGKRVQSPPENSRPAPAEPKGESGTKGPEPRPRGPAGTLVYVSRVVDGDTIEVEMPNGRTEDVRYIGVDTPETVDPSEPVGCFGPKASHFNQSLVEGRRVRLRFDQERRDYYGRLLAYVYLGTRFVNAELLRRGLARAIYYSPNGAHRYQFEAIARRAGRAGRGLWSACR